MANLDKIKDRVVSLLAKASDPAASEAEAHACMTKAQKLLQEHGLTKEECDKATSDDYRSAEFEARMSEKHGAILHPVDSLCGNTIGKFCGVICVYKRDGLYGRLAVKFYGLDADVALAEWLRASLIKQFDHDWDNYVLVERRNKALSKVRSGRKAFAVGFAEGFRERVGNWMYRNPPEGDTCTDLVIHKQELARAHFEAEFGKLKTSIYSGPKVNDVLAAAAGRMAAGTAQVGLGVHSGRPQIAIGKI